MLKISQKTYIYPITVELCEEGGFFASCDSLQGCHADGETYGEAIDNIREVIKMHIEARKKDKKIRNLPLFKNAMSSKIKLSLPVQA